MKLDWMREWKKSMLKTSLCKTFPNNPIRKEAICYTFKNIFIAEQIMYKVERLQAGGGGGGWDGIN